MAKPRAPSPPARPHADAEWRRLEAALAAAQRELAQARSDRQLAEQRFRSVFDQQFQFMVILSPQGRVLDFSEQLPLNNGAVPREQVLGQLFWDTVWWSRSPEPRADWPERLRRAALANGPVLSEDTFNAPDGEMRIASAAVTAVKDASGAVDCFIVQGTDITEHRRDEQRRKQLEAQLRETHKMQAIGTLAGGIAHDFNNILGAILGNLALAQQDAAADHPVQPRLAQIHKAASRARNLVRRILAFSRQQPHELVAQPLRPILEETLELLRSTLPPSVALVLRLSDAPLWVNADATQLQRVVMNLCANAAHALGPGRGRLEVGLAPADAPPPGARGAWVQLWVRDDGCGMDEATRGRIFEPFFTTRDRAEGTGLGLSVVHGIVAEHGGVITVESAPGRGSCFRIALPLADAGGDVPDVAAGVAIPADGAGRHVLYVDDDAVMTVMVDGLLRRAGYRVTTCADAMAAVALLHAAAPSFDVVVTDYNMPEGSGLDIADAVRALRPALPVVISSGYLSEELQLAARQAGVRRLLAKENTVEELGPLLRELLDGPAAAR
ncbi:MAG: ATP-binding protein [Pseudomonadota bacterium]